LGLFLFDLFRRRPLDFSAEVDAVAGNPFVETFVEVFVMNVDL
jgi:hypothetical protein